MLGVKIGGSKIVDSIKDNPSDIDVDLIVKGVDLSDQNVYKLKVKQPSVFFDVDESEVDVRAAVAAKASWLKTQRGVVSALIDREGTNCTAYGVHVC